MKHPVPVFMYHHVNPVPGDMVTVSPETFRGQMKFLKKSGYRTLSLHELVQFAAGTKKFVEKCVVITFDDGYMDNYLYAYPVLKEYGLKAAVFVVTDWVNMADQGLSIREKGVLKHDKCKRLLMEGVGRGVVMDWRMLREMNEGGIVGVYSHTVTHRRCADLQEDQLLGDVRDSKRVIEEMLGRECEYLCWPKGSYSNISVRIAADVGYRALFTTERGVIKPGDDLMALGRVVVKDSVSWFKKRARIYTGRFSSTAYLSLRGCR